MPSAAAAGRGPAGRVADRGASAIQRRGPPRRRGALEERLLGSLDDLVIPLIRRAGFFEGAVPCRVDPAAAIALFDL